MLGPFLCGGGLVGGLPRRDERPASGDNPDKPLVPQAIERFGYRGPGQSGLLLDLPGRGKRRPGRVGAVLDADLQQLIELDPDRHVGHAVDHFERHPPETIDASEQA